MNSAACELMPMLTRARGARGGAVHIDTVTVAIVARRSCCSGW